MIWWRRWAGLGALHVNCKICLSKNFKKWLIKKVVLSTFVLPNISFQVCNFRSSEIGNFQNEKFLYFCLKQVRQAMHLLGERPQIERNLSMFFFSFRFLCTCSARLQRSACQRSSTVPMDILKFFLSAMYSLSNMEALDLNWNFSYAMCV